MRPKILVTLDTTTTDRRGVAFDAIQQKAAYATAVERAGGLPILVAPTADEEVIEDLIDLADGIIITGGDFDIDPATFGVAAPEGVRVDPPKPLRTRFEWALTEAALDRDIPILGICGGMQLLNVVLGGTLHLHVADHEQPTSPRTAAHAVDLTADGQIAGWTGHTQIHVNSTHHQAVGTLGHELVVEGVSPDGLFEAIRHERRRYAIGVQWHPELLEDDVSDALYQNLVEAAGSRRR